MRDEVLRELEIIKNDCLESSDEQLVLVGQFLNTLIIAQEREHLVSLANVVSEWISKKIDKDKNDGLDIPPPSLN
jgi:hypothetical protein